MPRAVHPAVATPMREVEAVVALGANLGDIQQTFVRAIEALALLSRRAVEVAGVYRSAPWQAHGPDYLNTVCVLHTPLCAPDLLRALQQIETAAGRERPHVNAPRTLDLDLIFYGAALIESPRLVVPHPRWALRAFVMEPLAELRPDRVNAALRQAAHDPSLKRLGDWAVWSASSAGE